MVKIFRNQRADFHETWYVAFTDFSIEKSENSRFFSETIAACDLKVGRYRQLIEFMKVCEYGRSMSFLDLGPRPFTYGN